MNAIDDAGGWKVVLGHLTAGENLSRAEAAASLRAILAGEASDAQIAGLIVALRMKGETVDEMSGMVDAMLEAAEPLQLDVDAIDIVGTGGARHRREAALNVSTMASFVAAGAGVPVCKHGNRKASSTSGSFDLLDALGVTIELDAAAVATCVDEAGIGFCFARAFHPAMRHAGPVRADLGVPTVFNFLGPLSHPGRVDRQVIGVADPAMAERVVGVLAERGAPRAMVVHGDDGLDELTITTTSTIYELRDGQVDVRTFDPQTLGIATVDEDALRGGSPDDNARIARALLAGETGPVRDIVVLNAAAGLVVGGKVDELAAGFDAANASIDGGAAAEVLERLVEVSADAGT